MVAWPPVTSVLAVLALPLPSRKMWTQVPSAATQRPANACCDSGRGVCPHGQQPHGDHQKADGAGDARCAHGSLPCSV